MIVFTKDSYASFLSALHRCPCRTFDLHWSNELLGHAADKCTSKALFMDDKGSVLVILGLRDVLILRENYFGKDCAAHPSGVSKSQVGHVFRGLHTKASTQETTTVS
jgi:hypothetical protein